MISTSVWLKIIHILFIILVHLSHSPITKCSCLKVEVLWEVVTDVSVVPTTMGAQPSWRQSERLDTQIAIKATSYANTKMRGGGKDLLVSWLGKSFLLPRKIIAFLLTYPHVPTCRPNLIPCGGIPFKLCNLDSSSPSLIGFEKYRPLLA